jgi:ATP-dependent RNA helicase DDX46/PRP5
MFDMGFEPQIKMILQNIRPDRQTVLFSATFPKQIEKLAKSILKLPLEIVVGERSTVNKDITQIIEVHDEEDKFMRLLQLLGLWYERGSILIFVDKQEKCDQLFHDLLRSGYPCLSLHGGKDQLDRDHTLHEFKTLIKTVMVATSVAGRGLDVPEIVVVVNYNCPNHLEDYVHRVGRTGRAGRKGTAYTFISPHEEQYSPIMLKILEKAGQPIPQELLLMVERFKEKVERGEAKYASSQFSGKGFTFDASEMNVQQQQASMQRRAYDIEQGNVPITGEDDDMLEEEFEETGFVVDKKADAAVPAISAAALAGMTPIERAKALAASLSTGMSVASSSMPAAAPSGPIDQHTALARARMIAQQMASKSSATLGGMAVSGSDEAGATGHFCDELEINDYPPLVSMSVFNVVDCLRSF